MSYILDALRKSEQDRGQGDIPNVQTVHSSSLNYGSSKNTYWPYILIAAVLLNLIAIFYFIFDREKVIETNTPHTSEQDSKLIDTKSLEKNISSKKSMTTDTAAKPHVKKKSTAKPIRKKTKKVNLNTGNQTTKNYYDLPDSTKNKLPKINVSAHVFSENPLQRSIVINSNFMEEGEYVSKTLMVHKITRDGVIFDFEGNLISYSVVSQWQ